jgi:hypothetical protein
MGGRDRIRDMMTGADVRGVFTEILPDDVLMEVVKTTGLQQRGMSRALLKFRSGPVSSYAIFSSSSTMS